MVAAAIIGGAVVAGVGESVAASTAAGATTSATNAAIAEQNKALGQQANLAAPYTGLGTAALPQYEALLGIGTGGPGSPQTLAALQNTPGYQFTQQQGETGILNAASTGGGVGGDTLAALDTFNTGLAEGTYNTAVGQAGNAVALGQAAAAGQAANIGNAASNISGLTVAQGNNIAGIDANLASALSQNVATAGNQYTTAQTLAALRSQAPAAAAPVDSGGGPG